MSIFLFVPVYLLGHGLGGIAFPPYSEVFGRKKLYIVSTALYSVFCAIVGAVSSIGGVVVGRFGSGFLSAIPTTVIAGSTEDMLNTKDRIWMIYLWAMVSNLGLITGPIMSTYITTALGWRWMFYVSAIIVAVTTGLLFAIRESRPSLILSREVAKLRKVTGNNDLHALNLDHTPDMRTFARLVLFRPLHLFFTEPIVCLVAVMSAIACALIYLFTEALLPCRRSTKSLGFQQLQLPCPF
ncbi:hypothetical protein ONS95_000069 [Cadophora gregata]|uniref:uncharacterized protein n=1 Tax=Cadophora gregata TaxID=51156 RepID=UPI0026DB474A|nr:uncharacterized protein ONS95_000069 [Cadophora gregata]KAK0128085.1 hypothetical protein ONS95_000069 [Cadophora gregata]